MGEIKVLTIYLGWEWQIIKNNSQQRINVESKFKFDNKEIEVSYECLRDTNTYSSVFIERMSIEMYELEAMLFFKGKNLRNKVDNW